MWTVKKIFKFMAEKQLKMLGEKILMLMKKISFMSLIKKTCMWICLYLMVDIDWQGWKWLESGIIIVL